MTANNGVTAPASKPDETHVVERENLPLKVVLWPLYIQQEKNRREKKEGKENVIQK